MPRMNIHLRRSVLAYACALLWTQGANAVDLLQSYQAALEQDAAYGASRASANAAREALPQARAQLLPNVSATGYRFRNDLVSTSPDILGQLSSSHASYNSSDYNFSIRQPLYRKYQYAQYQQAKAQVLSADASLDKDRQDLGVRVVGAYLDALLAQDQLTLVQSQKTAYAGQLKSATRSFKAGVTTRTDIDEAQAKYDMSVAQELEATQNTDYTRRELEAIINQPVKTLATLDPAHLELLPPSPPRLDDWIERAMAGSPELRSLEAQQGAAQQDVEKARAGHYPTLDLVAQRDRAQSQNATSVHSLYLSTQVGVQFSVPLYSGGGVDSSVRQALANLEKVQQQREASRRNIRVQVQKEFQNITEGISKVRALEQAKFSAEQALYSTQKGLQAGIRTQIDVLNAEQQKFNAQRDLAQGRYLYVMARARLLSLTGTLGIEEITTINRWLSTNPQASAVAANH